MSEVIKPLPCIVCERTLGSALPERFDGANQPYAGTVFYAYGQYGSTIFDPMDETFLEVNICDDCLDKKARRGFILRGGNRDTGLVQWNGRMQ